MTEPHGQPVRVPDVMRAVERDVRERLRQQLVEHTGAAPIDEALFAEVEAVLRRAVGRDGGLLLPELLSDDTDWRLDLPLRLSSHRPLVGAVILFLKRRILLPLTRWLLEYSQENFRRQQRLNLVLCACIEELAIENARLRRDRKL